MDTLPVHEMNEVEYKSVDYGVMHACVHDAHTAMVLCLAHKLTYEKIKFHGKVRVFFSLQRKNLPAVQLK